MRGGFEEGELRDTQTQQVLHRSPPRRQGAVHELGQKGVDLAEAAERGEQQQAREGGIARGERIQSRRGIECLVERAAPAQDRTQRMGRDGARDVRRATGRRQSRRDVPAS